MITYYNFSNLNSTISGGFIVWKERVPKGTDFWNEFLFIKKNEKMNELSFSRKNNNIFHSFLVPIINTDM